MAKKCPFKKNVEYKDRFGYLINNNDVSAMKCITFGACLETDCMAYNYETNTCKLLEKDILIND